MVVNLHGHHKEVTDKTAGKIVYSTSIVYHTQINDCVCLNDLGWQCHSYLIEPIEETELQPATLARHHG